MLVPRYFCVGTLLVLGLAVRSAVAESKQAAFPFNLVEEHHAVAGRIQPDTYKGQRVVAILEGEGHGEAVEHFLKIEKVVNGKPKALTTKCCDITMPSNQNPKPTAHRHTQPLPTMTSKQMTNAAMTSRKGVNPTLSSVDSTTDDNEATGIPGQGRAAHSQIRTDHLVHIVHKRNVDTNNKPVTTATSLVTVAFVVMDTKAFSVDHDGYINVDDVNEIEGTDMIEFYVLLEDTSTGKSLSNPIPFVIYVDRPVSSGYPAVPAVFAGVLVLIVVFLACLIPFVTRAKRRMKVGKPVFKLGSHASTADLERADTFSDLSRRESEPDFMGPNVYYNYAAEVDTEKSQFGRELKDYARSHPPTLQLQKKSKYSSDESSSSGVDVASQGGAEGKR